jgi:hypothetical protein
MPIPIQLQALMTLSNHSGLGHWKKLRRAMSDQRRWFEQLGRIRPHSLRRRHQLSAGSKPKCSRVTTVHPDMTHPSCYPSSISASLALADERTGGTLPYGSPYSSSFGETERDPLAISPIRLWVLSGRPAANGRCPTIATRPGSS